jgi:hypothetical protein
VARQVQNQRLSRRSGLRLRNRRPSLRATPPAAKAQGGTGHLSGACRAWRNACLVLSWSSASCFAKVGRLGPRRDAQGIDLEVVGGLCLIGNSTNVFMLSRASPGSSSSRGFTLETGSAPPSSRPSGGASRQHTPASRAERRRRSLRRGWCPPLPPPLPRGLFPGPNRPRG